MMPDEHSVSLSHKKEKLSKSFQIYGLVIDNNNHGDLCHIGKNCMGLVKNFFPAKIFSYNNNIAMVLLSLR